MILFTVTFLCESCSRFDLPPLIYYNLKPLGKNVLAAWLSVLARQFETAQSLRFPTYAPTLDTSVVAGDSAPPPGAAASHARKASWAHILLDGIRCVISTAVPFFVRILLTI